MNFLLDTHTFLWYLQESEELSDQAAEIIKDYVRMLRPALRRDSHN